jgi:hypothetical protein
MKTKIKDIIMRFLRSIQRNGAEMTEEVTTDGFNSSLITDPSLKNKQELNRILNFLLGGLVM